MRCSKVENEITINEHMDLNIAVNKLQNENDELRQKLKYFQNKQTIEEVQNDLTQVEKDECKIIISEYLNNQSKDKKLKVKTANQLYYIIDFLIEYINNKERVYKEKMTDITHETKDLYNIKDDNDLKIKKMQAIIEKNNLEEYFKDINLNSNNTILQDNNISNSNIYIKSHPIMRSSSNDTNININIPTNSYVKKI